LTSGGQIKVSFVVIAYNEEKKIPVTLESLIRQSTDLSFEVIVIDDGSTDNTARVAQAVLAKTPHFKVHSLPTNCGRGFARLSGLELAVGEFIAFVDSDVELTFDWLDRCVSLIENKKYDAVSGVAIPDGDCVVISRVAKLKPRVRGGSAALTGNNMLIKRSVIEHVSFPDLPYGDDIRLAWNLELAGYRTKCVGDLIVKHSESKSVRNTVKWQFQQGTEATKLLIDYRKFRLPDLAWVLSIIFFGFPLLANPFSLKSVPLSVIPFIFITSSLFLLSRFELKIFSIRTYVGIIVNSLFMISYIIGRYYGVLILPDYLWRKK